MKKFQFILAMMRDTKTSPLAFRLACFLIWAYRNERRGGECFPGIDTLAADLAVNEKTVRRAVKELVDQGYFTIQRVGKKQSNRYWPIFCDRTQVSAHSRTEMSDHDSSEWTFGDRVSGHFRPSDRTQVSAESSLEPIGGSYEPPHRYSSTVDVAGGSRRKSDAPPSPSYQEPIIFRVGDRRRNSRGEQYLITGIDEASNIVTVRFDHESRDRKFSIPPHVVVDIDSDDETQEDEDDEASSA